MWFKALGGEVVGGGEGGGRKGVVGVGRPKTLKP